MSNNAAGQRRRAAYGMVAALLLAGCASAAGPGGIPPVAVADARASPAPLAARLALPAGAGPHPVVIVLHGCGGIAPNIATWSERLLGWGYGTLVLDSFQSRGVTSVCAPDRQRLVTRFDRAGDVIAAARWLQDQPGVDGGRIAVLGESHGGGTAATLANRPFVEAEHGLIKGAVDYYGPCRSPERYAGLPLLALAGDADTWADPARTCSVYAEAVPPGSPVAVAVYPGAVHGFDNARNRQLRFVEGHPMQFDSSAATASFERVRAFLARVLGPHA